MCVLFSRKRAPRCSFCKKPIVPKDGQRTAPRLRAMDRDFHPECFQCEVSRRDTHFILTQIKLLYFQECSMVLDSRVKGKECYPFKGHILCLKCNRKKLSSSEEEDDDDSSGSEYEE